MGAQCFRSLCGRRATEWIFQLSRNVLPVALEVPAKLGFQDKLFFQGALAVPRCEKNGYLWGRR